MASSDKAHFMGVYTSIRVVSSGGPRDQVKEEGGIEGKEGRGGGLGGGELLETVETDDNGRVTAYPPKSARRPSKTLMELFSTLTIPRLLHHKAPPKTFDR